MRDDFKLRLVTMIADFNDEIGISDEEIIEVLDTHSLEIWRDMSRSVAGFLPKPEHRIAAALARAQADPTQEDDLI